MKAIWKIAFVFLLAVVGGIFSVSLNTEAAAKPYEYTFEKDTSNQFNGISSINKLVITLDKNITTTAATIFDKDDIAGNSIYILQKGGTDRINIIKDVTISGKILTVTFKNLDFIDYADSKELEYELIIDKGILQFDQLEEYRIPFKIYDILPGFKSTFIDADADDINNHIFKINAPRDVFVHVPKIFIRGIETIHHYDGILPDDTSRDEQGEIIKDPVNNNGQENPALTNIDILADEEAARLKVEFGGNSDHSRDLARHPEVEGFTMGQAGIDEITDDDVESTTEFSLRAYNDYGRFLEQRNFKLKVTDPKDDFIINDYLPEPTDEFGQTYTLYDLMADQTLLENIITRIPVSQLDSLGITYKTVNRSVDVASLEELEMALKNTQVSNITLKNSIDLSSVPSPFIIDRSVMIEGSQFTGDVKLGTGQDINVRLNNVNITGDLTVDVGTNGTAILDGVNVTGTTNGTNIVSGGSNSVHLNDFESNKGITLTNSTPLRIVTSDQIKDDLTMKGSGAVTLEGEYYTVNVQESTTLNRTKNLKIITLNVEEGQTLKVAGEGGQIPLNTGAGKVKYEAPIPLTLSTVSKDVPKTSGEAEIGITLAKNNSFGYDLTDVEWKVINKDVFGDETNIEYVGGDIEMLLITNLDLTNVTGSIIKNVILQGIGTEANFEVTIPVEIRVGN